MNVDAPDPIQEARTRYDAHVRTEAIGNLTPEGSTDAAFANLRAVILAQDEQVRALVELLVDVEWSGGDNTTVPHCPLCSGYFRAEDVEHPHYADKYGVGHRDWCELRAALESLRGPEEGRS